MVCYQMSGKTLTKNTLNELAAIAESKAALQLFYGGKGSGRGLALTDSSEPVSIK